MRITIHSRPGRRVAVLYCISGPAVRLAVFEYARARPPSIVRTIRNFTPSNVVMPTPHTTPPTPARYTVHSGVLWLKAEVVYACPSCGEVLRSKLHEANTVDQCPACAARFRVPGRSEYRATRRRDLERARARRDRLRRKHAKHRASSADGRGLRGRVLRFATRRTEAGARTYPMLLVVAMAMRLVGVSLLITGPAAMAVLIYYGQTILGAAALSLGVALCLAFFTVAELILAVRDVAANSWHIRRRLEQTDESRDRAGGSP